MTTGISSLWICLVGGPATLVGEKAGRGQSGTVSLCMFVGLHCGTLLYVDVMK